CGEYGCLGDLGMHVCHVPFRAGWSPRNVRAVLSNIVTQRPDGHGCRAACDTWDNATMLCEAEDTGTQDRFPMTLKMQRIAPGERNSWYLSIKGTKACARFSTAQPKTLEVLNYAGGEQVWGHAQVGYEPAFPTITGGIFEFGFTDAILQMWAAFVCELAGHAPPTRFAGCVTPAETARSHRLFTAALESQRTAGTVALQP
ncbi:MAG: gfo/Idh/MocA family oxidoreductase, partial [Phycisphaerae bacterium]